MTQTPTTDKTRSPRSAPSPAAQRPAYSGPALLSLGFRPFFLAAGLWAAVSMALWVAMLAGVFAIPSAFTSIDWHVHELVYGYLPAVVAGFLLTAVPNWTGKPPIVGAPLLALFAIWLAGRIIVFVSAPLPPGVVAVADVSFLTAIGLVTAREIIARRNWRNLPVIALIALLVGGNATFHAEFAANGVAVGGFGERIGVAVAIFLILLIGGRITPSFTRNWLSKRGAGPPPSPTTWFDYASLAVAGFALIAWILSPEAHASGLALLIAGVAQIARLSRWKVWRTLAEPLVTILHIGYGFAALGFIAAGAGAFWPDAVARTGALHVWTAGAIGVMTLAVMTRASLGHTGRALHATAAISATYSLVIVSVLARAGAGLAGAPPLLLYVSAAAWIGAFAGFVIIYAPYLTLRSSNPSASSPRPAKAPDAAPREANPRSMEPP